MFVTEWGNANIWFELETYGSNLMGGNNILHDNRGKPSGIRKTSTEARFQRERGWVKSLGSRLDGGEVGFNALPHCHPDEVGRVVCVGREKNRPLQSYLKRKGK